MRQQLLTYSDPTVSPFATRVKEVFSFLGDLGFLVVDESDEAMGGGVTYRSPDLWIAIDWDRSGQPGLEFASTHRSWCGRVSWDSIDHLLRDGTLRARTTALSYSSAGTVGSFRSRNLAEIEKRFSDEHREATAVFLRQLEADRARRANEYWDRRAGPRAES